MRDQNPYSPDSEESPRASTWDGIDRRGEDRRHMQMPPPPPQYWYPPIPPTSYQQSPPSSDKDKNMAQTTLTLSQIGGIAIVVISIIGSVINVWSTMTKDIDEQKNNLEQFKIQITKDLVNMDKSLSEMKKIVDDLKAEQKTNYDQLDKRIQDIDSSVSQIYQKVSKN